MRYQDERMISARNFANKLWNASRFVIMNIKDEGGNFMPLAKCCSDCCGMACGDTTDFSNIALRDEDKWMISRINEAVKYVTDTMDKFDLALAGQRVYDLIWNEYCDWYIEIVKKRLWSDDEEDKKVARFVLVMALKNMLELLHPFMPFITEEIWSFLPHSECEKLSNPNGYLINAKWPEFTDKRVFKDEETVLNMSMEAITAIRNIRAEAEAAPSKKLTAVILSEGSDLKTIQAGERYIKDLANITDISYIGDANEAPADVMSAVIAGAQIFIPLDELVDYEAELERLTKEKSRLEGEVTRVEKKLANQGFVAKAPQKVVDEEKAKKAQYEEMLAKVTEQLATVRSKVGK
jgi:valyl-tRNA synthetase